MANNINQYNQRREWTGALGMALCIIGVSAGGLIKVLVGVNSSSISIAIVIISTLLLLPVFSIRNLNRVSPVIFITLVYNLLILVLSCVSDVGWNVSGVGFTYQFVYFLQVLLVVGIPRDYDSKKFISISFWIYGIVSVVALIIIFSKGFANSLAVLLDRTEDANTVSRATTAYIAFFGLCSSLIYKPYKNSHRIARLLFIVTAIVIEILSTRRSTILALVVILVIHIRKKEKHSFSRSTFMKIMLSGLAVVGILLILYFANESVRTAIEKPWVSLNNGIRTYLGLESSDMAAQYRRTRLDTIPDQYFNHSTLGQFVFGRGYNTDWLDIPFLQAFWDMGLLGGFYYLIIAGVAPLKHVLKPSDDLAVQFCHYFVILRIVQNFSNGTPYGTMLPFVLLYIFERNANHVDDSERVVYER